MSVLKELRIPYMGSVENARLVAWKVAEGGSIVEGDIVCEIETDKTVTEVQADRTGRLVKRLAGDGDELKVGALLGLVADPSTSQDEVAVALAAHDARIVGAAAGAPAGAPTDVRPATATAGDAIAASIQVSPRVRRLAQEHGIDLAGLRGTGPGGRPTGEDVLAAAQARGRTAGPAVAGGATPPGYDAVPVRRVANSLRRRTIARRLAESARAAPHVTADVQVDLTNVLAARAALNAAHVATGRPAVSVLSYVARATCEALQSHAALNATFTDEAILLWQVINLGIAVDTDDGLVVPVIRDAVGFGVEEFDTTIRDLATRARQGALRADELEGGTFTISNPGSLGPVLRAEAIINPPQVALLGLPGIYRAPVAIDDGTGGHRIEVRPLINPSLTFDHRALDGGQAIRFLTEIKRRLESVQ
jgi:pyruvate/2-oxoglutarate dehydrogenase complex dihydrolipoamide acyltransferase (E2) component